MRCQVNTIRKRILTAIAVGLLSGMSVYAYSGVQPEAATEVVEVVEPAQVVRETPEALRAPEAFDIPVQESKIARKMTQAEKNQNAAENDSWGGAITIIAMCIVLAALIVLSLLFMIFGKVSELLLTKKKKEAKTAASHDPNDSHELAPGEVIAAISMALSEHFAGGHDVEDTILTIRRLQKAYSPWNSKIYNLRLSPDHRRNPATEINFNESKRIQI